MSAGDNVFTICWLINPVCDFANCNLQVKLQSTKKNSCTSAKLITKLNELHLNKYLKFNKVKMKKLLL